MLQYRCEMLDGRDVLRLRLQAGDKLPMHSHPEHTRHDIIVTSGCAWIYGHDDSWSRIVIAGETLILDDDQHRHEIMALEDSTEVLNVYRRPVGHDQTPEGEWLDWN